MVGRRLYTVETYVRVVDREPSAEPDANANSGQLLDHQPGDCPPEAMIVDTNTATSVGAFYPLQGATRIMDCPMSILSQNKQIATHFCSHRGLLNPRNRTINRHSSRCNHAPGCARWRRLWHSFHDEMMQFVQVNRLELDELLELRRQEAEADLADQYVFIGIDANLKAIISYRVGKRDGENANEFLADLRRRIVNHP